MRALVTELFGALEEPVAYARVPEPYRPTRPHVLKAETPDKANAMLIGGLRGADDRSVAATSRPC